jgi:hypothetical protein
MVSTILILGAAVSSLALVWSLLRSGQREIHSLRDWETRKHEIDIHILQTLLDPSQERYLRNGLSHTQFLVFQRRRTRLTLRVLRLVEENAGMLMRLGQLAKVKGEPLLTQQGDEMVAAALQLRWNLLVAKLCLYLKWFFPFLTMSMPAFEMKYQHVLDCLVRVQRDGRQALA